MKATTILTIALCGLVFASCGNKNKKKQAENTDAGITEKINSGIDRVAEGAKNSVNYIDSLINEADRGKVMEEHYTGLLPGADVPGINYHLILTHQEKNDYGVYRLEMTYLEGENDRDMMHYEYGRYATFVGTGDNAKAEYIRLTPFDEDKPSMNFVKDGENSYTLLDMDMKKPGTRHNYTIVKVNK